MSAIFNEKSEIRERCKGVHCVDLGESFPFSQFLFEQIAIPTSIYLQNLASIQPRTSLVKFARSPRTDPPGGHRPNLLRGGRGKLSVLQQQGKIFDAFRGRRFGRFKKTEPSYIRRRVH